MSYELIFPLPDDETFILGFEAGRLYEEAAALSLLTAGDFERSIHAENLDLARQIAEYMALGFAETEPEDGWVWVKFSTSLEDEIAAIEGDTAK